MDETNNYLYFMWYVNVYYQFPFELLKEKL